MNFKIGAGIALAFLLGYTPQQATAATITFDLTCILANSSTTTCSNSPTFGTVTFSDLTGADAGKVGLTIDLVGSGQNGWKDLLFNFSSTLFPTVTQIRSNLTGTSNLLSPNGFDLPPYDGLFDVEGSTENGTTSEPFTAKLSGLTAGNAAVALNVGAFNLADSLGNFYLAIHIQSISCPSGVCQPGVNGGGSIKVAAGPGQLSNDPGDVPEPMTTALVGVGLVLAGLYRKTRS